MDEQINSPQEQNVNLIFLFPRFRNESIIKDKTLFDICNFEISVTVRIYYFVSENDNEFILFVS